VDIFSLHLPLKHFIINTLLGALMEEHKLKSGSFQDAVAVIAEIGRLLPNSLHFSATGPKIPFDEAGIDFLERSDNNNSPRAAGNWSMSMHV
jgi:hypothetical protein